MLHEDYFRFMMIYLFLRPFTNYVATLKDIFDPNLTEIYKGQKSRHLKSISEKSGCPLGEMVFFDNEWGNCQTVARIGVTVVYTPKGVTRQLFQEVLDQFPSPGQIIGKRKKG